MALILTVHGWLKEHVQMILLTDVESNVNGYGRSSLMVVSGKMTHIGEVIIIVSTEVLVIIAMVLSH